MYPDAGDCRQSGGGSRLGLRKQRLVLGVDIGATFANEQRVRVQFRNTGVTPFDLVLGGASGGGSMYSVAITSTSGNGNTCKLLNTTVGFVAGYVAPIVIRLKAGDTDYVSIDL